MKNLANILTITRIIVLPFIVVLFFIPGQWSAWACLTLYAIGALTDFFDGWVARKFQQESEFGRFLDPISDKIFVMTIMLMLVASGIISHIWVILILVIMMREFLVSGIREFLGPKNVQMPVTKLAKWKTTAQMVALGFLIIGDVSSFYWFAGIIFLCIATVLTVITGWGYLKASIPHVRG